MPSTFGIAPLIPGLVNEVALEIFLHFVAVDWDGPFTLVLVCTAWRDMVLRSNFLQSLRRNRRGRNPTPKVNREEPWKGICIKTSNLALRENREKAGRGICILSFDGGGPGSLSQLRILDELMLRLAFKPGVKVDELCPADYFDLMGGVGFGGLVALLLGRLRMTTSQAMEELAAIGTEIFPEGDGMVTREVNTARLRNALESMLERHGHPVDIQLRDSPQNRCKVVLFAAPTVAMDHCHTFRTYLAPRKCLECTFVDAACASMAMPEYFSSVAIGPRWRKQSFAGIPHGFDNPMREVLKESQLVYGETNPVSLVLSLGSGQRARPSDRDQHVTRSSSIHCDSVARGLQYQFQGLAEYLRLNVDNGMENIVLDNWSTLGSIETFTNVYLEMNLITKYIDKACQWLRERNGSVTLGQLTGTKSDCVVKFHSERLDDCLKTRIKQIDDVIQRVDIERITLIDAIGRPIRIPIDLCDTYPLLLDIIKLYFEHKKAPGSDFVERGDYRLVHGDRKNIVGQMEWTRINKSGLKVEMSMILHTRNQNSTRCPSCHTSFEGRAIDGWARCLFCSTQFQTETQVQVEPQAWPWPEDTTQSEEELVTELVTPEVRESEGREPPTRELCSGGEAVNLQFRLFSVINSISMVFSHQDNQNSASCPSCSTSFEGRAVDGWAQCPLCLTQFQIETQVQVEPQVRSEDTTQSDEVLLTELVTPAVRESEGSQPPTRELPSGGEAVNLQFRHISVIKTTAILSSHPPGDTSAAYGPTPNPPFGVPKSNDCKKPDPLASFCTDSTDLSAPLPLDHNPEADAYSGRALLDSDERSIAPGPTLSEEEYNSPSLPPVTKALLTLNAQERLENILGPSSLLENEALLVLLRLIIESPFIWRHEMEPTRHSDDGKALLRQIQSIPGCPAGAFDELNDSIFTLFVFRSKFCCLICGSLKQSMIRAIGCVRSHLDHRPFPCLGEDGCKSCPKGQIIRRFPTASLLHDHCNRQARRITCVSCDVNVKSNMRRHWAAKHPDTPFPYARYSNYQKP